MPRINKNKKPNKTTPKKNEAHRTIKEYYGEEIQRLLANGVDRLGQSLVRSAKGYTKKGKGDANE